MWRLFNMKLAGKFKIGNLVCPVTLGNTVIKDGIIKERTTNIQAVKLENIEIEYNADFSIGECKGIMEILQQLPGLISKMQSVIDIEKGDDTNGQE